ncbi:ArsC family reductase [Undibacterium sp. CY18W]|uniref:ArsC family reductase n=1 Tax=Undibacterium hunanense TaxID=2762292 RepID=A0ABR6ZJF4_9BURK|nr:ArsC family reductase [Undibacterium hunanense]MBC3916038.1 ArsC family reductase [Undibacterium hunanense]
MTQRITLFGIPNCDTVKKARTWLQEQGLAFEFHDFKKQGLSRAAIESWLEHQNLDVLINRKGTTWRALSDAEKTSASDTEQAIALMMDKPSVIKRPVMLIDNGDQQQVNVGFSVPQYQSIFKK